MSSLYNDETVNQYIYTIRNITDNNIWILLEKDPRYNVLTNSI